MTPLALPAALEQVLSALLTLGAAVWIGGFIAIMVMNRSARDTLSGPDRVALFRSLGRRYLKVVGAAGIVVVVCGGVLLASSPFDGITISILAAVVLLVIVTVAGVVQARRMTALRKAAHQSQNPEEFADHLRHGSRHARILRTLIGLVSLALFVLAYTRT